MQMLRGRQIAGGAHADREGVHVEQTILLHRSDFSKPLITVACNEDMTASDLVGRYLLDASGTKWHDGLLTVAARIGTVCYLDEVVETRQTRPW